MNNQTINEDAYQKEIDDLFKQTIAYFVNNKVNVPEDVKDAIEAAFKENEFPVADDTVNIYFKEDLKTFENDITLRNTIENVLHGKSSGSVQSSYTYCDNVDYGIQESNVLKDRDEVIAVFAEPNQNVLTIIPDPEDWTICVIETVSWENDQYTVQTKLYVYCPVSGESIE